MAIGDQQLLYDAWVFLIYSSAHGDVIPDNWIAECTTVLFAFFIFCSLLLC